MKNLLLLCLGIFLHAATYAAPEPAPARAATPKVATEAPGKEIEGKEPLEASPGPIANAATNWSQIHGVNYIPSYAASPFQCWMEYDGATVRRELAAAAGLGFNSVRIILSNNAYEQHPTPTLENFADFVKACEENHLTLVPVLFDTRGVEPESYLEGRESTRVAYEKFLSRPDTYHLRPGYERFAGPLAESVVPSRPVPSVTDPGVILWGEWTPSPAASKLAEENWPHYKEFVEKIIAPFKESKTVIAWDMMNELGGKHPLATKSPRKGEREFASAMVDAARKVHPSQPITISFAGGYPGGSVMASKLDLISVVLPQREIPGLLTELNEAKRLGREKPVLFADGGAVLLPSSEVQAGEPYQKQFVRSTVIALERERVGFYIWHLIEGRAMTPWAGLLKPDGTPKPAALWLKDWMKRRN